MLFKRKRHFSSFVTPDFKKRQNRNKILSKNGTKFTGMKKNPEQIVDNYRLVSLLPICSKIFEELVFDSIYDSIDKSNLFNNNQSGFRPSDSCIHRLIAITHNIFSTLDAKPSLEVCGVLLDLSKAFDRI